MKRLAVLNIVGLTESLIGPHTPLLDEFLKKGAKARVVPAFPAVPCTAQSNYLTGKTPSEHGIVANGWYNRELAEVQFWKQSNHIVQARKIWEDLRALDPKFTCAKLFWWFNMYSSADYSITPRPTYPADGRKVFDIYTWPYSIRTEIKTDLGEFPFPCFWGPAAGVDTPQGPADAASRWIAESAKWIENKYQPTLNLIYLPHLDYNLQRHGPSVAADVRRRTVETPRNSDANPPPHVGGDEINPAIQRDLRQIDAVVGDLISFFQGRSVQVLLLSEYGITNVDTPIHLNRLFRENGWLVAKDQLGLALLDCGASRVFAVADHQVAHIYLNDHSLENKVRELLERTPGVAGLMGAQGKKQMGLNHPRAGDLIAVAAEHAWFTYYYWLDDAKAPDFARTVDIHRKPGYDPAELFFDPARPLVKLRAAWALARKALGLRYLMAVISLDPTIVRGTHGRLPDRAEEGPVAICSEARFAREKMAMTDVFSLALDLLAR